MLADKTFFVFHRRPTVADIRSGASPFAIFGHVEAFGFTDEGIWFFYNPIRSAVELIVTADDETINIELTRIHEDAKEVWVTDKRIKNILPPIGPINCVSQCAHLIGLRAFTIWGLRRKLRQIEAEIHHDTE